jgi:predicted TIM-barrel fold metal-dependent hydrolase
MLAATHGSRTIQLESMDGSFPPTKGTTMASYRYISADSHMEVSPDRWTDRVAKKWRDRAPRRINLPDGGTATLIENRPLVISGLDISTGGGDHHQISAHQMAYDTAPGTGSPEQRLKEQDIDNLEAEVLFAGTGGPGFWRGVSNNEAYESIHAWNEFCIEDYASVAPNRLIPLGIIPQSSIDAAVTELEYCAKAGFKGVWLSGFPSNAPYPVPEDDRFWEAAVETGIAITTHLSWCTPGTGPTFNYARKVESSFGDDPIRRINKFAQRSGWGTLPLIFSGIFDRLPGLTLGHLENQLGWIPHWLDSADDEYDRHMAWMDQFLGVKPLARKPSEYILDHTWWGFIFNPSGVKMRHIIGVDKCLWSTDMPHFHSDWPNSMAKGDEQFEGVSEEDRFLMVRGNVIERFHLDTDGPKSLAEANG